MVKKSFLKSSLTILAIVALVAAVFPIANVKAAAAKPSLTYSAHVQTDGWKQGTLFTSDTLEKLDDVVYDEPTSYAGTMGRSLRMEALEINLKAENTTLKYRAHVQTDGWQDWVTADSVSDHKGYVGTVGASKRMEAVQISVEGLEGYKLLYRAHVQGEGWQDWVDAEDSDSFAGTTGKSKRIEALEIAVVTEDGFEYKDNEDGTHTLLYNDVELNTGDCTYGEWAPATEDDDGSLKRTCTLCKHEETKTLSELLNDESTTKIEVKNVKSELTVPAGKTLTVEENIKNGAGVTVNGTLVLKKQQNNLKLTGKGTVVYAPEATDAQEFATKFPKATEILNGLKTNDAEAAKSLKYEIKVPEMETPQTITEASPITLKEGWDLTVDLGNNILKTNDKQNSFITNEGDLILKNGVIQIPDDSTKFVVNSGANTTATLNLENVDIVGHSGISTNGNLTMNGGKIESTGTSNDPRALQIFGEKTIKATVTELNNVDVISNQAGIYIHSDLLHDLVMINGSINVKANGSLPNKSAIYSNSQYSSITLDGTKITSEGMGIYLQNGGSKANELGGNVAHLKNVTINSVGACIWTVNKGDKVEVSGGSYTSSGEGAVLIYNNEMNYFENCRLQGEGTAIKVLGSLLKDKHLSDFVTRTNVEEVNM